MSFDYDAAMADPQSTVFINVSPPSDVENSENMEGWSEDE